MLSWIRLSCFERIWGRRTDGRLVVAIFCSALHRAVIMIQNKIYLRLVYTCTVTLFDRLQEQWNECLKLETNRNVLCLQVRWWRLHQWDQKTYSNGSSEGGWTDGLQSFGRQDVWATMTSRLGDKSKSLHLAAEFGSFTPSLGVISAIISTMQQLIASPTR